MFLVLAWAALSPDQDIEALKKRAGGAAVFSSPGNGHGRYHSNSSAANVKGQTRFPQGPGNRCAQEFRFASLFHATPTYYSGGSNLKNALGSSPWYWKTSRPIRFASRTRFRLWTITAIEVRSHTFWSRWRWSREPEQRPRLALSIHIADRCRFGRPTISVDLDVLRDGSISLTCFQTPDQLKVISHSRRLPGVQASTDRIYIRVGPLGRFFESARLDAAARHCTSFFRSKYRRNSPPWMS